MSSSNGPDKSSGQFHSMKGTAVETVSLIFLWFVLVLTENYFSQVGNVTGSKDWQTSGKQEHAEGEGETKAAEAKGWAEGAKDQVAGYKDKVVGAVTNDKSQEVSGTYYTLYNEFWPLMHLQFIQGMSSTSQERLRRRLTNKYAPYNTLYYYCCNW